MSMFSDCATVRTSLRRLPSNRRGSFGGAERCAAHKARPLEISAKTGVIFSLLSTCPLSVPLAGTLGPWRCLTLLTNHSTPL